MIFWVPHFQLNSPVFFAVFWVFNNYRTRSRLLVFQNRSCGGVRDLFSPPVGLASSRAPRKAVSISTLLAHLPKIVVAARDARCEFRPKLVTLRLFKNGLWSSVFMPGLDRGFFLILGRGKVLTVFFSL